MKFLKCNVYAIIGFLMLISFDNTFAMMDKESYIAQYSKSINSQERSQDELDYIYYILERSYEEKYLELIEMED